MKFRAMKITDLESIWIIWKKNNFNLAEKEREIKEAKMMLKLNPQSCFVVTKEKDIIGCIFGVFHGRRGWIYHLAVDPKWQGKGVGRKLMEHTEKALIKMGCTRINLWVDLNNLRVVPFYEKTGYIAYEPEAVLMKKEIWGSN